MTSDTSLPDDVANQTVSISVWRFDDAVVLEVSGEIDLVTAPRLAAAVRMAADEQPSVLVIDLLGVSFLASAGMAVLAEAQQLYGARTRLRVVATGAVTSRVLELTGLDQLLDVRDSREDALAQ